MPEFDEVAAARAAHARAHRAHHAIHPLNDLVAALDGGGELLDGAAEVIDRVAADWPEFDRPGTLVERVRALHAGLLPLAQVEKEREEALEKLLYAQYHRLQDDPEWADVRAELEPLYAERAALFDTLAPTWHTLHLRRAAIEQIAAMRRVFPTVSRDMHPDGFAAVVATVHTLIAATAEMAATLRLDVPPPPPPPEDADADALEAAIAAFDAWAEEQASRVAVFGEAAERDHERWKAINRAIEAHTG